MKRLNATFEASVRSRIQKIPIVETLKMQVTTLSEGMCELLVPRRLDYDGVFESFHGGLLMTVADSAACFAAFTMTGPEAQMTTTDMNIRFLTPCLTDVTARARVIRLGRTLCPVEVDLLDSAERRVALAQINYFLLQRIPHRSAKE